VIPGDVARAPGLNSSAAGPRICEQAVLVFYTSEADRMSQETVRLWSVLIRNVREESISFTIRFNRV
jgi:hypothetical protein